MFVTSVIESILNGTLVLPNLWNQAVRNLTASMTVCFLLYARVMTRQKGEGVTTYFLLRFSQRSHFTKHSGTSLLFALEQFAQTLFFHF